MESICKNHPDRVAKRKCHYCMEPICSECQVTITHHIYCSTRCYILEVANRFLINFRQMTSNFLNLFKEEKIITFRNILDFMLILGIIVSVKIGIDNYKILAKLQQKPVKTEPSPHKSSIDSIAKKIDTLTVFSPPPGTMVLHNRFDIEGETEENRIVSLSANGKLLRATVAQGRWFSFKNVLAKPGQNRFTIRAMKEDGSGILLEEIKFFYGKPSLAYLSRDFVRGRLEEKKIALTFDGGYLDNAAHEILEILKQEQVTATMFLTGVFLRKYPDLVKQMVADGHEIGNHTWTHPHLTTFAQNRRHQTLSNVSPEMLQQELLRTAKLFKIITGNDMSPLWRAPYGEHNQQIRQWAATVGFRHIGWTVGKNWEDGMDSMDWVADKSSQAYHTAEEVAEKILSFGNGTNNGANGTIILMHLGTLRNDDYPHQKLPMIIDQLKKRGYKFVTISEML